MTKIESDIGVAGVESEAGAGTGGVTCSRVWEEEDGVTSGGDMVGGVMEAGTGEDSQLVVGEGLEEGQT